MYYYGTGGARLFLLLCFTILFSLLDLTVSKLHLAPAVLEVVRYVNESYIVTCQDESKKSVTWMMMGNRNVGEKGHPHVSSFSTGKALVFENIYANDRGQYTCQSENEHVSFNLTVISPISFLDTPLIQTAQEHKTAIVKCLVAGDPKPKVLWKFEGRDVTSARYSIQSDGLQIDNVSLDDRGTFTCRAYQVSPVTSMYEEKNIKLNIQHKPMHKKLIHPRVNQAYGYKGGEVNLSCEAVAEPMAEFTWFRPAKKVSKISGRIIQRPHRSILHLYIKNESFFGDYLCKASNSLGTLDQIVTLLEGEKPPKPRELRLRGVSSDTLNIEIVGPNLNETQLSMDMMPMGYRIQYRLKGMEKWDGAGIEDFSSVNEGGFYILTRLIHNTEYEIRAATRNIAGISDYTSPVVYKTLRLQADSITSGTIQQKVLFIQLFLFLLPLT